MGTLTFFSLVKRGTHVLLHRVRIDLVSSFVLSLHIPHRKMTPPPFMSQVTNKNWRDNLGLY